MKGHEGQVVLKKRKRKEKKNRGTVPVHVLIRPQVFDRQYLMQLCPLSCDPSGSHALCGFGRLHVAERSHRRDQWRLLAARPVKTVGN